MPQTHFIQDNPDLQTALNLLDKWITRQLHILHQPGVAVGIVHQGELLWGKGYGLANVADDTPVTLDTRFRIASISKTFTATAILQLRDMGKLRLDDPVSDYLDWFKLRYPDAPPITIYHLLTHTSGLPRDASIPHWTENKFQSWDDLVATTKNRRPTMPPLEDFSYSNLGYSLLGGIIEAVSGETWEDYIQRRILDVLDMRHTIVKPEGNEADLATGYLRMDDGYQRATAPFAATNGFSPSASLASNIHDLVKYAKFHLSKGQTPLLSAYSLRDMHRPHWLYEGWNGGYGLGISTFLMNDWQLSGHSGGYKGYLTQFALCRKHDFGVIALTNSIESFPFQYVQQAYKLVLPELMKITAKSSKADTAWQQYVGTYHGDWSEVEVVVRDNELQVLSVAFINEDPTCLEPTGTPHEFIIREVGNPGETARFELADDGSVSRLWMRNEYMLPKQ
ncbi:MAG: serine hydrolase domain-containing protein [Aggregatilineales bacterium]